jgi:hypothetical protein
MTVPSPQQQERGGVLELIKTSLSDSTPEGLQYALLEELRKHGCDRQQPSIANYDNYASLWPDLVCNALIDYVTEQRVSALQRAGAISELGVRLIGLGLARRPPACLQ